MRAVASFLLPLLWSSVYQHAAGSGLNVTEQEQDIPILKASSIPATKMVSSEIDYEEEDIKEVMAPQFLVGDSGRGELQLKNPVEQEDGRKNTNKQKRKGNKEKKNKKKNRTPCEGEFKNFCVHGECKYIENLPKVTCKCLPDYFGERCVEQFLKTQSNDNAASNSFAVLASIVGVVGLTLLSFAIIVIIIIVRYRVRKKCPKYDEKEERKKLRHENGSPSNGV